MHEFNIKFGFFPTPSLLEGKLRPKNVGGPEIAEVVPSDPIRYTEAQTCGTHERGLNSTRHCANCANSTRPALWFQRRLSHAQSREKSRRALRGMDEQRARLAMTSGLVAATSAPSGRPDAQETSPAPAAAASAHGLDGGAAGIAGGTQHAAAALLALRAADCSGAAASGAFGG